MRHALTEFYDTLKQTAKILAVKGGIGLAIHNGVQQDSLYIRGTTEFRNHPCCVFNDVT
jgi:hypothetical protein